MVGSFTSMGNGSENAPNRGIYGNDVAGCALGNLMPNALTFITV